MPGRDIHDPDHRDRTGRLMDHRRILVTVAAVTAVLFGVSVPAWAYFTASASSTVPATATSLAAVTGVGASVTDANDVLVTWTAPSNPAGTTYVASTTAGTACSGTTSCTVSNLAASTMYTFTVTPKLQGWKGPGATKSVKTTDAATQLAFTSDPWTGAASNSATVGAITVEAQSVPGVPAPGGSALTVNLTSNSAGTPIFAATSGGTSITSVTIPAHSSSVSFYYGDTTAGSPMVKAAASGLGSATQTETITPAMASKVVFTTQPSGAVATTAFTGQPVAAIEDALGNVVTSSSSPITLAITSGTGATGATLSGCSATTTSGVASFSGCKIDKAGTGYTLTASSGALTSATSTALTVAPLTLSGIVWSGLTPDGGATLNCPTTISAVMSCTLSGVGKGNGFSSAKIQLVDQNGHAINNSTGFAITVKLTPGGGTLNPATDLSIANNASTSGTSFAYKIPNGNNKSGTATASIMVNSATYTIDVVVTT